MNTHKGHLRQPFGSVQGEVSDMEHRPPRQLRLFDSRGPSLNVIYRMKATMREAIKRSDLSREQIVDRMKEIALVEGLGGGRGSTITVANLDAWVSETKSNLIPIHLLPVFCRVTGSVDPIAVMLAPLGAGVVDSKDMQLLEWAKVEMKSRQLARQRRKMLQEIENE